MATTAVGEARPCVTSDKSWLRIIVVPCMTIFTCLAMVSPQPSFFIALPWWLLMLISWGVYMSLAASVVVYVHVFLPLTPAAVDNAVHDFGLVGIGFSLGFIHSFLLTLGSKLVIMTFTCVTAVFIIGMLVLWAFLVGRCVINGSSLLQELA
ncbi:hypothetical protein E2562_034045 [Oryza meyeriana var. granulata]|uniref:DUF7378 domain-containing protein n=1 Tax=Oryza meyeriana var. granulata TaxID=110450 RepID=A0A6G1E693_9ORYZ|nr:hypothetical protein E2562_034045 [Oryza meyeriana var. granulata]